ncbi:MAG: hypothetical protein E6K54_06265 [Gammaproteobacteria bacterium]|nr:MAG: hypothetical protein E6K54_06265 [Gammaproteobacteria bacterium]
MPYTSRLNPTQLNNLNLSYIEGALAKNERYTIEEGFKNERIKKISNIGTSFFVFQAVADSKNSRQRKNLLYINDVIQQFEQNSPDPQQKNTLLIPLMLCRLWKKHCVLVEITIEEGQKKINIHDSQSWWRNLFYPNCLNTLKKDGYQIRYNHYAKQADNFSCTYFVYHYIKEILINSVNEGLKNIFVSLSMLKEKDPIGQLIHDNFKQKYPNIREIESGEFVPWQHTELKNYFNITNSQLLNNRILDIIDLKDNTGNRSVMGAQEKANSPKIPFFKTSDNQRASLNIEQKMTYSR